MGGENNVLKKLREKSKSKKGFTLVELIVVIVIILILAAVMVPLNEVHRKGKRSKL